MDDALIVGAGPAGLAVAVQLRRYGRTMHIFEAARPGGLLWNANQVENYPGFAKGVPGPTLAQVFVRQLGAERITRQAVLELDWEADCFRAVTSQGVYMGRTAVIASGTKPRVLSGFAIPEALRGRVFYEVADLLALSGQRVIIVGSGDAAFDYALNLGRRNSVIILNRGERVKCLPLLWDRAQACTTIQYRPNTTIQRLASSAEGGMLVECSSPSGQTILQADTLIGAIGREPQMDFVSATLVERLADFETRGILHLVGDVKNGIFRQSAIAVGDGIRAGMRIHQVLEENAHEGDRFNG